MVRGSSPVSWRRSRSVYTVSGSILNMTMASRWHQHQANPGSRVAASKSAGPSAVDGPALNPQPSRTDGLRHNIWTSTFAQRRQSARAPVPKGVCPNTSDSRPGNAYRSNTASMVVSRPSRWSAVDSFLRMLPIHTRKTARQRIALAAFLFGLLNPFLILQRSEFPSVVCLALCP